MSLQKIQTKLKAPKGQTNSFGGYKYRNCEDILEAVKPLLAEFGYSLTISDDMVAIGGEVSGHYCKDGDALTQSFTGKTYVKATATLRDADGKVIAETSAFAREEDKKKGMDASQLTGATSSYARKYCLNGLFLIDDTKDSDFTNTK